MRDLDLAEMLGYASPFGMRQMVKRNEKRLGDCFRSKIIHNGPGRPGYSFWLTRRQTQLLTSWSKTKLLVPAV